MKIVKKSKKKDEKEVCKKSPLKESVESLIACVLKKDYASAEKHLQKCVETKIKDKIALVGTQK